MNKVRLKEKAEKEVEENMINLVNLLKVSAIYKFV